MEPVYYVIAILMMAGAMIFTVWGWSRGQFTPGDVVLVNSLLMQLFRPLDMLGRVRKRCCSRSCR